MDNKMLGALIEANTSATYHPIDDIRFSIINADNPAVLVREEGVWNNGVRYRVYIAVGSDLDGDKQTTGLSKASWEVIQYLRKILAFVGGDSNTRNEIIKVKNRELYAAYVEVYDKNGLR